MENKKFIRKWEHQELNGTWFYILKWHFIYVLLLLPLAVFINNYSLLVGADSFSSYFKAVDFSKNAFLSYGLLNGIAFAASFLRWKILESKYYRLKVKEVKSKSI